MSKQYGFSLIELSVTLAIIAILAGFGVQVFSDYFEHRKQRLFMQQLYHDLKWTRVEAIVLDVPVAIQAYNSEKKSVSTDWCNGWVIYKNSENHELKQASQVLKIHSGLKDCRITFSSFPDLQYFEFLPEGNSDSQHGTYRFDKDPKTSIEIIVNQTGRVRWAS